MILCDVVIKRRGKVILGPVTHELGQGGLVMVIGPNGSGKTTLLRVMFGMERLAGGRVARPTPQPKQAFVFQSPIILRRSVAENLAYPLRLAGKFNDAQVNHWLERIGLTNKRDMQATRMSGGERQKLAIARALIAAPDLLFLDEPCANLDGQTTAAIETLLLDTARAGTQVIMATHDMAQARRLGTDVIFMHCGLIHETGLAPNIMNAPQTSEMKSFIKGDILL